MARTIRMALLPLMPVLGGIHAAEVPKVPVPASPYLPGIYRFADALIEHGRDTYGEERTGLLLSALDRTTMAPLTNGAMISAGANPQHDQNLLRLFYTLSELSTRAKYRDTANAELKWLMDSEASAALNLLTNRDASWEVMHDKLAVSRKSLFFKPAASWYRPWMLWEQCFTIAPEGAARIVIALAENTRVAQTLGARELGFHLRTLAVAYSRTTNHQFLRSLETLIDKAATSDQQNEDTQSALSLAIDCAGAAHHVPEPLASRLRETASRNDTVFLRPGHNVKKNGFFIDAHMGVGGALTKRWDDRSGTTARTAMMCVSRYENSGDIRYRELIHAAADTYMEGDPAKIEGVSPMTLGHALSLELAAWRSTAQQKYLDRARYFGDWALKTFFDAPLPRGSTRNNHYSAIAGADTLALSLVELHLNILGITAVRCPANTIDR